jgi:hypothetical protein
MTGQASAPPVVDYVVLDPALRRAAPERFAALLEGFAAGYAAFFSGDEAEPTDDWQARIAGKAPPEPVMRVVVAVERSGPEERVVGGASAEYYRAGGCVLATYLYVAPSAVRRHRGHARAMLARARTACEALGPVQALLAEVEWPELLASHGFAPQQVDAARTRLRFFARLGARRIDFDYLQPPLGPGKQAVPYLKLLALPPQPPDEALRPALDGFLGEFYAALARYSGQSQDGVALARMRAAIAAARPLTVPLA